MRRGDAAFVEREEQIGVLVAAYQECAQESSPRLVTVEGSAGAGKSTLIRQFIGHLRMDSEPPRIAHGEARARFGEASAFQPIRDALAELVNQSRGYQKTLSRIRAALVETAPDWLAAVPAVGDLLAAAAATANSFNSPPATVAHSMPRQFVNFVGTLLVDGPLVLILDDMHWADESSVDLLVGLFEHVTSQPLLVVLGFRPEDLERQVATGRPHPLKERLLHVQRYQSVTHIRVPELTAQAVVAIWRAESERPLPPQLHRAIVRASDGNALFISEFARWANEQVDKGIPLSSVVELLGTGATLPDRIASLVDSRLMLLASEKRRTLEVCSVLGVEFPGGQAVALSDLTETDTKTSLRALCRDDGLLASLMLSEGRGGYRFAHHLVHDCVERRLSEDIFDYQDLHRRAASLLSSQATKDMDAIIAVGQHFDAAGCRAEAVLSFLSAAQVAHDLGAYPEVVNLLGRLTASELAANSPAWMRYMHALVAMAMYGRALQLWASLPPTKHRMPNLALLAGRSQRMINQWEQTLITCAQLKGLPLDDEEEAQRLTLVGEVHLCSPQQDLPAGRQAFEAAIARTPESPASYRALGHLGLLELTTGQWESAFSYLHRAVERAEGSADVFDKYEAIHWLSKAHIAKLNLLEAALCLDELERITRTHGVASASPFHARDRARALGLRGESEASAIQLALFLDSSTGSDSHQPFSRALTTVACHLQELKLLELEATAKETAIALAEQLGIQSALTPSEIRRVWDASQIGLRSPSPEQMLVTLKALPEINSDAVDAADAIFRFDIPDLWRRRAARVLGS